MKTLLLPLILLLGACGRQPEPEAAGPPSLEGQMAQSGGDLLLLALDVMALDIGRYPTQAEGLELLVAGPGGVAGLRGPYLPDRSSFTDPWGHPYVYKAGAKPQVISYGADGKRGGRGANADVVRSK